MPATGCFRGPLRPGGPSLASKARLDGAFVAQLAQLPHCRTLLRAPSGAGAPQIRRAARARGSVLTCSQGAWAPDLLGSFLYRAPQSFAYQWQMNGSDIAGATGSSYTPSTAGSYSCRVTAANQAGSTSHTSKRKRFHKKPKQQKKKLAKATTERSAR